MVSLGRRTHGGFLSANLDVLDVVRRLAGVLELLVNDVRRFGSGLRVCPDTELKISPVPGECASQRQ